VLETEVICVTEYIVVETLDGCQCCCECLGVRDPEWPSVPLSQGLLGRLAASMSLLISLLGVVQW
jgi:hypothetical protein